MSKMENHDPFPLSHSYTVIRKRGFGKMTKSDEKNSVE